MIEVNRSKLLELLNFYFSLGEIKNLCFKLDIEYENLGVEHKQEFARELIQLCDRHGKMLQLVELCKKERPHADWFIAQQVSQIPKQQLDSHDQAVQEIILIVEDDLEWQEHIETILKSAGYICRIASDYVTATRILKNLKPKVIVVDLDLKGAYGLHLAPAAKSLGIPLIVVTGSAGSDSANISILDYGAVGFFDKAKLVDEEQIFLQRIANAILING